MRQGRFEKVLTKSDVRTARELYVDGWSMPRIADVFGVSKQAIWKLLKRRGVAIDSSRPTRDARGRYNGSDGGKRPEPVDRAERDEYGCIVTLHNLRTEARRSLHIPGKRLDALRLLVERIDASDEPWRLLCYSTPSTISADLRGARAELQSSGKGVANGLTASPEAHVLALIGRLDLLDPTLVR